MQKQRSNKRTIRSQMRGASRYNLSFVKYRSGGKKQRRVTKPQEEVHTKVAPLAGVWTLLWGSKYVDNEPGIICFIQPSPMGWSRFVWWGKRPLSYKHVSGSFERPPSPRTPLTEECILIDFLKCDLFSFPLFPFLYFLFVLTLPLFFSRG